MESLIHVNRRIQMDVLFLVAAFVVGVVGKHFYDKFKEGK